MLPITRLLCPRISNLAPVCRASLHSFPLTPCNGNVTQINRPTFAACRWKASTSSGKGDEFISILGVKLPSAEPEPATGDEGLGAAREPEPITWFTSSTSPSDVTTGDDDDITDIQAAQVIVEKKKRELDFHSLPIVLVKLSKNNTRIVMTKSDYSHITTWTAGCSGFSGSKRATNVAGEATGEVVARRAREKGFSFCRIIIRGMGAARLDALKGLERGGLRIVSITDENMYLQGTKRARKRRRV